MPVDLKLQHLYENYISNLGSTGFCYCVAPATGVKIVGTEVRGKPQCGKNEILNCIPNFPLYCIPACLSLLLFISF